MSLCVPYGEKCQNFTHFCELMKKIEKLKKSSAKVTGDKVKLIERHIT